MASPQFVWNCIVFVDQFEEVAGTLGAEVGGVSGELIDVELICRPLDVPKLGPARAGCGAVVTERAYLERRDQQSSGRREVRRWRSRRRS